MALISVSVCTENVGESCGEDARNRLVKIAQMCGGKMFEKLMRVLGSIQKRLHITSIRFHITNGSGRCR